MHEACHATNWNNDRDLSEKESYAHELTVFKSLDAPQWMQNECINRETSNNLILKKTNTFRGVFLLPKEGRVKYMGLFGSLIGGAVSSAIGRAIERAKNKSNSSNYSSGSSSGGVSSSTITNSLRDYMNKWGNLSITTRQPV